ncbi:conserved hypothetical protein [Neisseria gonorrhoeae DGI2]|uniref:Uncharacterized protein n=1 Tax=Neisseria gonorrhoeae (strain NCCP11945) TaxID=521006 RepID=B4RNP3_NEIG2|nr:Conserved hypothetical protein [Neisseria gonorrhoeae NCCP11945]EFE05071.1 conserved hypothetical protein [Neisseria gonorrhoeae DGI2]
MKTAEMPSETFQTAFLYYEPFCGFHILGRRFAADSHTADVSSRKETQ